MAASLRAYIRRGYGVYTYVAFRSYALGFSRVVYARGARGDAGLLRDLQNLREIVFIGDAGRAALWGVSIFEDMGMGCRVNVREDFAVILMLFCDV